MFYSVEIQNYGLKKTFRACAFLLEPRMPIIPMALLPSAAHIRFSIFCLLIRDNRVNRLLEEKCYTSRATISLFLVGVIMLNNEAKLPMCGPRK